MAEVKVKVIEPFRDRTADLQLRKKDDVLTVSEERAQKLAGLGLVELIKEELDQEEPTQEDTVQEEPVPEVAKATKTAKRTAAKKG